MCGVTPPCSQAGEGINLIISVEISKIWMLLFGDYKIKAYFCNPKYNLIIGDTIMMLGMNAPKARAKGEYARAIRQAVHDSIVAIREGKVPEMANKTKYTFEWRV